MRRVLVTGASGFLGRHTQRHLLERGFEVHGITHSGHSEWAAQGVEIHRCNLLNAEETGNIIKRVQPTHLLHLAWITEPGQYWESLDNLRWGAASMQLLLQFAEYGGLRAVIAGSCAEYDWDHPVCIEGETPLNPSSLYGITKNALRAVAERFAANVSISLAWGRLFFPYGPHEAPSRLVPSVICSILQGEPAYCTSGTQLRDFIFIEDAAEAFAALLDSPVRGAVNIATGAARPLRDMIMYIGEEMGHLELIQLGTIDTPSREVETLTADITRLKDELGFTPSTQMETGLRRCIDWWRGQPAYTQTKFRN